MLLQTTTGFTSNFISWYGDFFSMSTDDAFFIAVLGVNKYTTLDGGAQTIAVSLEPIFSIDGDGVDLSLTTIWDGCDAPIEVLKKKIVAPNFS